MSGGGDVRVLRQEPGQESPRMPAWKREILERRKAKGGGCGGAGASAETSPGGAGPQRGNGDASGSVNGSNGGGGGASSGSGRNYTISAGGQHFTHNKETRAAATTPREEEEDKRESLVLQESLGPLEENPFIKLEKERRRRQDRESAARPVQHILELYGSVPGIRTIRAENIIIIESDPDYYPEDGAARAGTKWQTNGVSSYSSLNDLLDRRGSAVTEIRAKEVVIYDTTLSKSEENLSTLGHQDLPLSSSSSSSSSGEAGRGQGRVSRMLQKFDSNYGKLQKKSRSTENLLDLDCGPGSRPRLWRKPRQPDLVPKPGAGGSQPSSPVFQGSWSSIKASKPQPPTAVSDGPGSPQRATTGPPQDEPDNQSKPARERDWEAVEVQPKPKVPCSPETRAAEPPPPSGPVSSKAPHVVSPRFEIRPALKPDLRQIPDGDAQALALANLRLHSRNSFTVIPKRRVPVKSPDVLPAGVPTSHPLTPNATPSKRLEEAVTPKPEPSPAATSPSPSPTSEPLSPGVTPPPPAPSSPPSSPPAPPDSPVPPSTTTPPSPDDQPPAVEHLPVTNIDDIEVEHPSASLPVPSPMVQRRKGNTFTVVPKQRRADPEAEAPPQPGSPEPQPEAASEAPNPPGSTPGSAAPQAPYSQLGSLLKKRYPAVEEIEVVGGYLSLSKSCLAKTGSTGKKLQISFNESSLQSTYEYPSESSAWDSGDDDDDDDDDDGKLSDEQPSMVGRIHIPRPGFSTSPTHTGNSNDLSSYIPKHSVDFSAWQEHKHEAAGVHQEDAASQRAQMTEEVMLTPADSSSLSDYSSEPALYF